MKRAIGWCLAWALYWLGDVASKLIMSPRESRTDLVVYPIYNKLMGWSYRVQHWSGARSPWSKA